MGTIFPPREHLVMSGDIRVYQDWGRHAISLCSVNVRNATKYFSMHKVASYTKNDLACKVSGAEVEKPWDRLIKASGFLRLCS